MRIATFLLLAVGVVLGSCADDVSEPPLSSNDPATSRVIAGVSATDVVDVPAIKIMIPEPKAFHYSVAALNDAITETAGWAAVGFKPRGARKLMEANGQRAAVSAAVVRAALSVLEARRIDVVTYAPRIGVGWARLSPRDVEFLLDHPLVDFVEPSHGFRVLGAPMSSLPPQGLGQVIPWGIQAVNAPAAWESEDGSGTGDKALAIIDTGVDFTHPDLPAPMLDYCYYEGGCLEPKYHGTHVAGIALALDNTEGTVGVAPGASFASLGACDASEMANVLPICSPGHVENAIGRAVDQGVDVINLSLGSATEETAISLAVEDAMTNGDIVVVAAAGNGDATWPALYRKSEKDVPIIGVSGITEDRKFASSSDVPSGCAGGSSAGDHVDIAAPFYAYSTVGNGDYADEGEGWCGTSMAAPHVAAAALLVRNKYPDLNAPTVTRHLMNTASVVSGTTSRQTGAGLLDVHAAVSTEPTDILTPTPDPPYDDPVASILGPSNIQPDVECTWHASVTGGEPGFNYRWTKDGVNVSFTSSYTGGGWPDGPDYFDLQLEVYDVNGQGELLGADTAQVHVTLDPYAKPCFR